MTRDFLNENIIAKAAAAAYSTKEEIKSKLIISHKFRSPDENVICAK